MKTSTTDNGKEDRQCTWNVTFSRVYVTTVADVSACVCVRG